MGSISNAPIHESTVPVIVVGAGPVGLLSAYELSRLDIPCILAEQSLTTTKWPKMDLTNCRTMEILRMWGLADEYRAQEKSVPKEANFDSIFIDTVAPGGRLLHKFKLPSVQEWREEIHAQNDGSQPAEPSQRCSQIIFEAWMKRKCLEQKLIDGKFGWKFQTFVEDSTGVKSTFVDLDGKEHIVRSKYLVGCDGGGSMVRRTAGIKMTGGSLPFAIFLTHFKSKELTKLNPFGRFWHLFPPAPGFLIDQDHEDTYTSHWGFDNMKVDSTTIDPKEAAYNLLGAAGGPYRFKIDEVLVSSTWRPNFAIAEKYISDGGRVLLAGDAAHRIPPHGGYGMNTGIEDAVGVAWRLAAMIKGYGGEHLIPSYEAEQRPIMVKRIERCDYWIRSEGPRYAAFFENPGQLLENSVARDQQVKQIVDVLEERGSECLDRGIELDTRYQSAVICQDDDDEPLWQYKKYKPSTKPGSRAPALFLNDGKTNIVDLYGRDFTLLSFIDSDRIEAFAAVAKALSIPVKVVKLLDEMHTHKVWGTNHALVRADGHVVWRGLEMPPINDESARIWKCVTGQTAFPAYIPAKVSVADFNLMALAKTIETLGIDEKPMLAAGFQY